MEKFDEMLGKLNEIQTGHGNLGESLLQMNAENLEASGLDDVNYTLVRLAALIAVGAPVPSYELALELGKEVGITPEQVAGVLVAIAPVVGGPTVLTAAQRLNEAGNDLLT